MFMVLKGLLDMISTLYRLIYVFHSYANSVDPDQVALIGAA